jgi:serine/threonine protein kinase
MTALVMEWVDGEDLSHRRRSSVADALAIGRQIADALEAAHDQGVVHRDLKPANVKVRPDGTVKVLDFGLASVLAPSAPDAPNELMLKTQPGTILGTPPYMSPEQVGGEPVDRHADIWAFGVVLYELLTGMSPFARPTRAETIAAVLGQQWDDARLPPTAPANEAPDPSVPGEGSKASIAAHRGCPYRARRRARDTYERRTCADRALADVPTASLAAPCSGAVDRCESAARSLSLPDGRPRRSPEAKGVRGSSARWKHLPQPGDHRIRRTRRGHHFA